jgi:hypothetical protein
MSPAPAFFQRLRLVSAARRALAAGRPRAAIELLDDPRLAEHERAARLRARALEAMRRPSREAPATDRATEILSLLRNLAERMGASGTVGAAGVASLPPAPSRRPGAAMRFLLAVDDAGAFVAAIGPKIVIGHSRGGRADLPFLADVAPDHALLRTSGPTFHDGASWHIEALGTSRIEVDGESVSGEGRVLTHGDRVFLAHNCGFRFLLPDPASASALLELEAGAECLGAHSILLVVPGAVGRVRIGERHHHHVHAPLGEHPVELRYEAGELRLACEAPLRIAGALDSAPVGELALACPPAEPRHISVGEGPAGQRPFGIAIAPVEVE